MRSLQSVLFILNSQDWRNIEGHVEVEAGKE